MEKLPATSAGGEAGGGVEDSFSTSTVVLEHSTIPAMQQSAYKKKSAKKPKPKVKRVPFEECLAEVRCVERRAVKVFRGTFEECLAHAERRAGRVFGRGGCVCGCVCFEV